MNHSLILSNSSRTGNYRSARRVIPGALRSFFHNLRAVLRDRRETARSAWGHFRRINQSERAVSRPPAVTRIQFLQEPGCRFRIAFYGPSFAGFHDWNLNEEGTRDHGKVTRKYGGPAHV